MIRNPAMQVHLLAKNKGVAIKHLHLVDIRKLKVLITPLELQHRFAVIAESIEQQKNLQREHLAELDRLFASLQSLAFKGEL
jgi:type I restriction enzyme, S subunit